MHQLCYVLGAILMLCGIIVCASLWPDYIAYSDLERTIRKSQKILCLNYLFSGLISGILFLALGFIASKVQQLADHLLPKPVRHPSSSPDPYGRDLDGDEASDQTQKPEYSRL